MNGPDGWMGGWGDHWIDGGARRTGGWVGHLMDRW